MGHSPGALLRAKPDQPPVAAAKEFTSSLTSDAGQSSTCENGTPHPVGNVFVAGNILDLGLKSGQGTQTRAHSSTVS